MLCAFSSHSHRPPPSRTKRCWWLFSWKTNCILCLSTQIYWHFKIGAFVQCTGCEDLVFPLNVFLRLACTFSKTMCRMRSDNDDDDYRMQPIARCTVSCCRMKVYLWHFCFIAPPFLGLCFCAPAWLGRCKIHHLLNMQNSLKFSFLSLRSIPSGDRFWSTSSKKF